MSPWGVPGYSEERHLGTGASGRVVAAVHIASGQRVAIKYLSPRLPGDPAFLAGFRAEAALLRSLTDPHLVRLFDYVEEAGQGAAIIMELVDGVSLHEMITSNGATGPEPALLVLKGSLLGLAAAHALGIVHRDYKPENVLVNASGESKLTDFGIAIRAGSTATGSGTPLYMAPEQWGGAPATPATDIYAASAVFFECLTGKTPFSGRPAELAAQHALAAVPVELVDGPLRELVSRGMAKDPALRPADASAFIAELEATAASAYGADWERRGRAQLAERAAALLLLLLPHGGAAVVGGTGTSSASSWLPGAKVAAAKGSLSGWQLAVIAAVVAVAAAAAVVGGGTLVAKLGGSSAHGTASSVPGAVAGPDPAVCGSSPAPPLAYVTFTGTAQIPTGTSVAVRCGTGPPRVLGSLGASIYGVVPLAWSSDGTQLGWLTGADAYVARASAGTWSVRHWACPSCAGLAFQGQQAVSVSAQAAGSQNAAAIPRLLVFPATGSGPPAEHPVTGITTIRMPGTSIPEPGTEFHVLGSFSPAGLMVSYGYGGGNSSFGTPVLYRVNAAGQATAYPYQPPLGNLVIGRVGSFAGSQAAGEFDFSTGTNVSYACFSSTALALDTATGGIIKPKTPAGGGPNGWLVEGTWVDRAGTPYVSLIPSPSDCATNVPLKSAGLTPVVCRLSGGSWVPTGRGVFRAAYGPGTWLAEESGVTAQNGLPAEALVISGGTGTAPVTVPSVRAFAWAP